MSGLKWKSLADRKALILEAMEEYKNQENSRLLEEKAKLIEENTWVSVKDRLPEQDTWILAYSLMAFRFSNQMVCLHGESGKFYAKGFELHPDEITHWKPLTSPQ